MSYIVALLEPSPGPVTTAPEGTVTVKVLATGDTTPSGVTILKYPAGEDPTGTPDAMQMVSSNGFQLPLAVPDFPHRYVIEATFEARHARLRDLDPPKVKVDIGDFIRAQRQ